jgi:sigma-E factor negative regulatory protein RseA
MEIDMETPADTRYESLSALMDGQLSGAALAQALQDAGSAQARESWRVYHLVGDVLRRPELARGAGDLGFAEQVGQRLPAQAAVGELADGRLVAVAGAGAGRERAAANDAVFRWKMAAGLASVVAVVAIGWGTLGEFGPASEGQPLRLVQAPPPAAQAVALAQAPASTASAQADAGALALAQPQPQPQPQPAEQATEQLADGQAVMLRDPQLDELLAAHRATTGAWALGGAGGFLRNATYEGADR